MANGPILWGGNSTANNLQNYLTSNSFIGSNSGQRNYLQTWYFFNQNPTTGIVTSLTSTGNRTTNTTFWGSSTTSLLSYVTSSPLRYTAMAQMALTGASGAQFVETPMFTLDVADIGKTINISLDYSTSGTFAAGDCTIQIINYSSTGTYQATITPSITNLPSTLSFFQASFTGTSTASDQYSIRFLSNNAALRTFNIDSIYVGPGQLAIGTPISAPIAYTPTAVGFGTVTNMSGFYTRVGDCMLLDIGFISGTVTATTATISLPSGLTIDTTKMTAQTAASAASVNVGSYVTGTTSATGIMLSATTTSTSVLYFGNTISTSGVGLPQNGSTVIGSSSLMSLQARIPIAQWSTQTTLGTSSTEFASNSSTSDANDTTSFVNGAAGSIVPSTLTATRTKRIQFAQPIQSTDNIQIEIQNAGTGPWLPLTTYNASAGISPLEIQNTIGYGIGYTIVSAQTSQIDITFGQYSYSSGATYGLAGTSWATANTAGTRWRIRRSSGIGVGELAPATVSSAGYVNGQSGWVAYTPTFQGFGTVTSVATWFRRIGDSMDVNCTFTSGTNTGVAAQISLPTGYAINTTKISSTNYTILVGTVTASSGITNIGIQVVSAFTTGVQFCAIASNNNTQLQGTNFTNNNSMTVSFVGLPIVGWS